MSRFDQPCHDRVGHLCGGRVVGAHFEITDALVSRIAPLKDVGDFIDEALCARQRRPLGVTADSPGDGCNGGGQPDHWSGLLKAGVIGISFDHPAATVDDQSVLVGETLDD